MASVLVKNGSFSVRAYRGDAKTLLAFNLPKAASRNLAGFTIQVGPPGVDPYYLLNELQFEKPANHAQVATLPANSSVNAPIHKFRWLHVPGAAHQGTSPIFGKYTYTVTPRYFDDHRSLQSMDATLGVSVPVDVKPFDSGSIKLGFTRGFVQSQAFVRHFTPKAVIRPAGDALQFDPSVQAGVNAEGLVPFTFADEYRWLGFTARERIFELLNELLKRPSLGLDVFAYDLNEPDVIALLLKLAKRGGVRVILDNAALHHDTTKPTPEDQFEQLFTAAARKGSAILRGKFGRYSHDKIFIVSDGRGPRTVLTGSTNLSVTGLYVNSNHVLVFTDRQVAATYAQVFQESWTDQVKRAAFMKSAFATARFDLAVGSKKKGSVTFSPHADPFATEILQGMATRIAQEGERSPGSGSVLFAVMEMASGTGPVFPALEALHADQRVFSYGISDNPDGIALYKPGQKTGVLVTGKPTRTKLPRPFSDVPSIGGGHQIHHKFVVCGFNGQDPVVYCGSSNLALGGEENNGDNLLEIHDAAIATAFAIEAVALVDHFHFLNTVAVSAGTAATTPSTSPPASKPQAAADAGWFLGTTDRWTLPYFDPNDLHSVDRQLFA